MACLWGRGLRTAPVGDTGNDFFPDETNIVGRRPFQSCPATCLKPGAWGRRRRGGGVVAVLGTEEG